MATTFSSLSLYIQDGESSHKPDGMSRLSRVRIEVSKLLLDDLPRESVCQSVKRMFFIELLEEGSFKHINLHLVIVTSDHDEIKFARNIS